MSTIYCHRPNCRRVSHGRRDERGRPLCDRCAVQIHAAREAARASVNALILQATLDGVLGAIDIFNQQGGRAS